MVDGQIVRLWQHENRFRQPQQRPECLEILPGKYEPRGRQDQLLRWHRLRPRQCADGRPDGDLRSLVTPGAQISFYGPPVRTVLDVGGQDIKAIRCDEKGKVTNFLMNDGQCQQAPPRHGGLRGPSFGPIGEVCDRSFPGRCRAGPCFEHLRDLCQIRGYWPVAERFATNEVWRRTALPWLEDLFALERVGIEPEFAITGGMAKNRGVVDRLQKKIGLEPLKTQWDSQLAGAAGAALFGYALCQKGKESNTWDGVREKLSYKKGFPPIFLLMIANSYNTVSHGRRTVRCWLITVTVTVPEVISSPLTRTSATAVGWCGRGALPRCSSVADEDPTIR